MNYKLIKEQETQGKCSNSYMVNLGRISHTYEEYDIMEITIFI